LIKTAIHVNQAYTRCNLLPLKNNNFITSDKGIYSALTAYNLNVLYVNPKSILLPGFKNGFFGGACGTYKDQFFVIGSLASFMESEKVRILLHDLGYQIVELYDGQLYDGGSLVFSIDFSWHSSNLLVTFQSLRHEVLEESITNYNTFTYKLFITTQPTQAVAYALFNLYKLLPNNTYTNPTYEFNKKTLPFFDKKPRPKTTSF